MTILNWNAPKKTLSTSDWKESDSFDSGPYGGYIPNMSTKDAYSWKAKFVGKTTDHPQVEIRKSFNGAQILMIVSLGNGYNYKYYKVDTNGIRGHKTKGVNIHWSCNGAVQITFKEMEEIQEAIKEAKEALEKLKLEKE